MTNASEIRRMVANLKQIQSAHADTTVADRYVTQILEVIAYELFVLESR